MTNKLAMSVAKWRPVLEVGSFVRVKKDVQFAGKSGRILMRGLRPDGRTFWLVRLNLNGSPTVMGDQNDREFYSDEIELR